MGLRAFLWVTALETLLSLGVFVAVVVFVDPTVSGFPGRALLYGSVFFFISGLCVWFLSWMRGRKSDTRDLPEKLGVSFRQGILLGLLTVVTLVLQSFRVLVWWTGLLAGVAFLFLEVWFLVKKRG